MAHLGPELPMMPLRGCWQLRGYWNPQACGDTEEEHMRCAHNMLGWSLTRACLAAVPAATVRKHNSRATVLTSPGSVHLKPLTPPPAHMKVRLMRDIGRSLTGTLIGRGGCMRSSAYTCQGRGCERLVRANTGCGGVSAQAKVHEARHTDKAGRLVARAPRG